MKQFINLYLFLTLSSAVPYSFATDVSSVDTLPVVDHGVGFSLSLDYGCVFDCNLVKLIDKADSSLQDVFNLLCQRKWA